MSGDPRRIALYMPTLTPGGAERVMVHLARGLCALGHPVDFVLARAEGEYLADLPPQVRVVDLGRVGGLQTLRSLPGLVAYLRRERPHALLAALNHANIVALVARGLAGVPTRVVVSVHNTISDPHARGRDRLLPWLAGRGYRAAQGVVAVSAGVAEDLCRATGLEPGRVRVIYNPVLTPELPARAAEPAPHPWLEDGAGVPVVLAVGRLEAQKDYPTLLRAFAGVRQVRPARLLILGEGSQRPALEALIRELNLEADVALAGHARNPYAAMARAAVFALSSTSEGLPTVLIEALALGARVVATNCPHGPAEILAQAGSGTLVAPGDHGALARALLSALDAPAPPPARLEPFGWLSPPHRYLELLL